MRLNFFYRKSLFVVSSIWPLKINFKHMKQIILLVIVSLGFWLASCEKGEIGYLITEEAGYLPDSMVIRTVLDPSLDASRIKYQTPWFSTEIQGVEGTDPISYSLSEVNTDDGNAQSVFDNVELKGIGVLYIPYENTLEPGRYYLTVKVSNVNGDQFVKDAFTLIVE